MLTSLNFRFFLCVLAAFTAFCLSALDALLRDQWLPRVLLALDIVAFFILRQKMIVENVENVPSQNFFLTCLYTFFFDKLLAHDLYFLRMKLDYLKVNITKTSILIFQCIKFSRSNVAPHFFILKKNICNKVSFKQYYVCKHYVYEQKVL